MEPWGGMYLQEGEQSQRKNLKLVPVKSLYRTFVNSSPYQQPRGSLTTKPGQVQMKTGSSSSLDRPAGTPQAHQESRKESEKAGADTSGEPPLPLPMPFLRSKPCWARQTDPRRKSTSAQGSSVAAKGSLDGLGLSVHVAHRWWPGIMTPRSLPIESRPMILSACLWKPSMNSQRSNQASLGEETLPPIHPWEEVPPASLGSDSAKGFGGPKDTAGEGHSAEAKGQLCAVFPLSLHPFSSLLLVH